MRSLDVAIVGAGPYGLSVAAHIVAAGHKVQVFGRPLSTWAEAMPAGMTLKSDGYATCLSAPGGEGTLAEYCAAHGLSYKGSDDPPSLETFVAYGLDFQRRFFPRLDTRDVRSIEHDQGKFKLTAEDGEHFLADRIVLAVGITHFSVMPKILADLPRSAASHSAEHHRLDRFSGCDVAVVGRGASAVDIAALLLDLGARPTLITRNGPPKFWDPPGDGEVTLWQKLRRPPSPIGPGWRSRMASDFPDLFRQLPAHLRHYILQRHVGPSSRWQMRDRVVGKVAMLSDCEVRSASVNGSRVGLTLSHKSGESRELTVDHVIAATGYWPQVERLHFLSPQLRAAIAHTSGVPVLSRNFESSVSGLYFTGLAAAGSFGPLLRFVAGADFTARRVSQHVARQLSA